MTNHQALEHLASTAITLGHLCQGWLDTPAKKGDFDTWYARLSHFVNDEAGEEDLKYILKKADSARPKVVFDDYRPLFEHYVDAIFAMREKLENIKAVVRLYNAKEQSDGTVDTVVGEYILHGGNIFINDINTPLKIDGNPRKLLLAFLTENESHILSAERIVELTPSDRYGVVVEASKRVDKLNEALKPYHDKKRMVVSIAGKPLRYELRLAKNMWDMPL